MNNRSLVIFVLIFSALSFTFNGGLLSAQGVRQSAPQTVPRATPFSKGVNFSQWFEVRDAQRIPFNRYTEQDFANVKSLGADVIRLPIRMHDMTSGAPNYTLDPLLLKLLDMAVDWAEKYRIYLIIDNHSFDPVRATPNDIDKVLLAVWAQLAQRYRSRSDYILYEILNEPHGITDRRWGEVQGMAVDTIRRYDQRHAIIVGGTDYNSINKLSALPNYSDTNLIYTFHYYDPHIFTHQGADWGEPKLSDLAGVPFPYDRARMPRTPASLRGTWYENSIRDYEQLASPQTMNAPLDKVVAFAVERNVPVFCGEFGVYVKNSQTEDRARWYQFVTAALDARKISRTSWDYYGGFGIFNVDGKGDFNTDLNVPVARAMGFTPPTQRPRPPQTYNSGIVFFDDYPNPNLTSDYWGAADSVFSLFAPETADGDFAILWGNATRYNAFNFTFPGKNADLSQLASGNYVLEFKARADKPVRFDVRFINPENSTTTPWRMTYTINETILPPDGKWHTIRIPLNDMHEHGAWVNATQKWLGPQGEFTWTKIDRLEFAAEHSDLKNCRIWFDSIRITR